jgi:hypothetical protein
MPKEMSMSREMSMSDQHGGHLYMQTNETQNRALSSDCERRAVRG